MMHFFTVTIPGDLNAEFTAWLNANPDPYISQIVAWAEAHGLEVDAGLRGLGEYARELARGEGVGL